MGAKVQHMGAKPMRAREFKAAVKLLFRDGVEAAERLGVLGGKARISEWARGTRTVPTYIAAHVRTLLSQRQREGSPTVTVKDSGDRSIF